MTKKMVFKRVVFLIMITLFLLSTGVSLSTGKQLIKVNSEVKKNSVQGDLDPLVDLKVTVAIKEIRALDSIDKFSNPDFYLKIFIDGVEHVSPIWFNRKYVETDWCVTQDVPDNKEFINITIQLWDWNDGRDKLCDISRNYQMEPDSHEVNLFYSLKTAHWMGDDYIWSEPVLSDPSGYGRLNGCDDNSIYENDRDCELLFDIYQTDFDGDEIPYWTEVNVYGTDPTVNDKGRDDDHDGVPIEWEFKWGHHFAMVSYNPPRWADRWDYDPFIWEDHKNLDPDEDGLDNVEEYLTSKWGSDPFRKDIFLEVDRMEIGPNGEGAYVPELSKELLRDAFSRHNIRIHINEGWPGGGEIIPFDVNTSDRELQEFYFNYFL
ncbi:MAG TPA: hypothetical protein ENI42_01490, partial [Thermoplasmatales archaeon]|nr:hypothetical protein [Thermoplasmatales archaeon]